MIYELLTIPRF